MGKGWQNYLQALLYPFDAAGQVNNQSTVAHTGNGPGSIACLLFFRLSRRMASGRPGTSRSMTARVASGVLSRGLKPVPPVVRDQVNFELVGHIDHFLLEDIRSSGKIYSLPLHPIL